MARSSLFPASVQPGKPVLPPCPPGWTTVTFGDVLEIVERPIDLIDDVEYQLVTAKRSRGGVVARNRLMGRDVLTKTQFLIARDDFLMSNRQIIHGGCGIVPAALDGAVVSNEYSVLRPKSKLLLEFLGYLTHSIYFQQTCFHASVGVDVEKMIFNCERWLEFRFNLPPLHEQRRIAEILSSVDEAIAATRAVIEQTRKVKQGVLERLLTRGIGHTRFKQTEIGEIPDSWRITQIGDVSDVNCEVVGREHPLEYEIRYVDLSCVDGPSRLLDPKPILFSEAPSRAQRVVRKGDILVSTVRPYLRSFCRIDIDDRDLVASTGFAALHPGPEIDGEFLYQHVLSRWFVDFLTSRMKGSNYPAVTSGDVSNYRFALPPLREQREIANVLAGIDGALQRSETQLISSVATKSVLMSDLLTGRKRVADALPMAAE